MYANFECLDLETMVEYVAGHETTDDIMDQYVRYVTEDVNQCQVAGFMSNILMRYDEQNYGEEDKLQTRPQFLREKKKSEQLFYHIFKFCGLFNDWSDDKIMENVNNTLEAISVFKNKSAHNPKSIKYGKRKVQYQRAFYNYMMAIRQFPYRFVVCNHIPSTHVPKHHGQHVATVLRAKNSDVCLYGKGRCPLGWQSCACSQVIYEKCIFMRRDGRYMVIGNDCVYMLTRSKPIRYMNWLDKWKKDGALTASNFPESNIQKQMECGTINQHEFKFLIGIRRKKKLTVYQLYHRTILRCRIYNSCRPDCDSSPEKTPTVMARLLELSDQLPNCSICSKKCLQLNKNSEASESEHLCGEEGCKKEYLDMLVKAMQEEERKKLERQRQREEEYDRQKLERQRQREEEKRKKLERQRQREEEYDRQKLERQRQREEEYDRQKEKWIQQQEEEKQRNEERRRKREEEEEEEYQQHRNGSIPIGFGKYCELPLVDIINRHPGYVLGLVNKDDVYNISKKYPIQYRAMKAMVELLHSAKKRKIDPFPPTPMDLSVQRAMELEKKKETEETKIQDYLNGSIPLGVGNKYPNETLTTIFKHDRSYVECFTKAHADTKKLEIIVKAFHRLLRDPPLPSDITKRDE